MTGRGFYRLFFRLKRRQAVNHLRSLRRHRWVHLAAALAVLALIIGGGTALFDTVFAFLLSPSYAAFGSALMDELLKMVLLAFFSMLVFSNLIIMLTTTYFSREVEFLMGLPIAHRRLFFAKLGESMVYSSWAFLLLSFPLFAALGHARRLGPGFYAGAALLLPAYLIVPATIGAAVVLLLTAFIPPRRLLRAGILLAVVGGAALWRLREALGLGELWRSSGAQELSRLMRFVGVGDRVFWPSGWFGRGLLAAELGRWSEFALWAGALWSTALLGLAVCDALAERLYYRGWCAARSARGVPQPSRGRLFRRLMRWLAPLPAGVRCVVAKDAAVFWRDPAQWSQVLILFGLLFIYVANLRSAAQLSLLPAGMELFRSLISLFNTGATAFVLSIVTTRFVYPMLSLEGRQQWVLGLAPLRRTSLVWIKFAVACAGSLALAVPLVLLSCVMLGADAALTALALATTAVVAVGLNALAVGLGAWLPNFDEDNPSRIANGLGGTLNVVLSLVYIAATLALEAPWIHAYLHGLPTPGSLGHWLWIGSIPMWLALQAAVIAGPLALGLAHWKRMEF